jgi:hypothetical protein
MEIGRGWLVQLGSGSIDFAEGHGRGPRFKKDVSPSKLSLSIKHMLQIEPGNPRHKDTAGTLFMTETPETVIAGPVVFMGGIVSNHRLQIAYSICCVSHEPNMTGLLSTQRQK